MSAPLPQRHDRPGLDQIEQVVAEPLRFKAKLSIGENAYTSLRTVNKLRELWDVLGAAGTGAAIAKSSLIASTFFAPSGLLGMLGIGAAAAPMGWVALAAVASGGACYGMYRLLGNSKGSRVVEIPRFLNTPLDALGLALFDLLAPMALRMAAVDGAVSDAERECLVRHLVDDWGLDPLFVQQALAMVEPAAVGGVLNDMAIEAAGFLHANPDCNHEAIAQEYIAFLRQLLASDGAITLDEEAALAALAQAITQAPRSSMQEHWRHAKAVTTELPGQVKAAVSDAAQWTQERMATVRLPEVDAAKAKDQLRQATQAATRQAGATLDAVGGSAKSLLKRLSRRN